MAPRATSLPVPAVVGTAISGATRSVMGAATFNRRIRLERPGMGGRNGDAFGQIDARPATHRHKPVTAIVKVAPHRSADCRLGGIGRSLVEHRMGQRFQRRQCNVEHSRRSDARVRHHQRLANGRAFAFLWQQLDGAEVDLHLGDVVDQGHDKRVPVGEESNHMRMTPRCTRGARLTVWHTRGRPQPAPEYSAARAAHDSGPATISVVLKSGARAGTKSEPGLSSSRAVT